MTGVIPKLAERMEGFPQSERKVAQYVSDHLDTMVGLSIKQLSTLSDSSEAAVVRFCKTLGYKGYRDFSIRLAEELAVNQTLADKDAYSDIREGDDAEHIIRNVSYHNIQALEDSSLLIDAELVVRAAEILFQARRIDFYGLGASNFVAQDAQYKFMRISKPSTAYADPHMQLISAENLTENDAAVAISWSGETKEVLDAVKHAKKNGAPIIAITRCTKTSLAELADICFGLSAPEVIVRCGAMSSRIAQLTMVDILFSCIFSRHYQEVRYHLDRTKRETRKSRGGDKTKNT